ncbi:MAG: extracellular solute-binding protein, partial [Lachnospiraceae bacterium]|nr:extracellular solute-binding protein [Lachnospiraceae bacterium]
MVRIRVWRRRMVLGLTAVTVCSLAACGSDKGTVENLVAKDEDSERIVDLFGPMEKSKPDAENIARSAFDETIRIAEERLGVTVEYHTYTAENYQEKTYDDVALDRVRNNMDDLYLLNPDTIQLLGSEGYLLDLSQLENAENLREVVKTANTVNGMLVAIPQEVVVNGLFVNQDMFDQYGLSLPETPEDLLECCRVFKENGIETPIGANRW